LGEIRGNGCTQKVEKKKNNSTNNEVREIFLKKLLTFNNFVKSKLFGKLKKNKPERSFRKFQSKYCTSYLKNDEYVTR
jgi:hypothetical protein